MASIPAGTSFWPRAPAPQQARQRPTNGGGYHKRNRYQYTSADHGTRTGGCDVGKEALGERLDEYMSVFLDINVNEVQERLRGRVSAGGGPPASPTSQ